MTYSPNVKAGRGCCFVISGGLGLQGRVTWHSHPSGSGVPNTQPYAHLMQTIHVQAQEALERTQESMSKYYDQKAKQQPDITICDQVMLNVKNTRTKRPAKKLSPKHYGPFKVLEK